MRSTVVIASLLFGAVLGQHAVAVAPSSPVRVMQGLSAFAPVEQNLILYREGDAAILKVPGAVDADFQDVYAVNLSGRFDLPGFVEELGEVLEFVPARFVVMKLKAEKAEELAARLHMDGHACGVLTLLTGRPISTEAIVTPTPRIPVTTRDARIERIVDRVTEANIRATVEELSNIYTRHHSSATGGSVTDLLAEKYESLRMGRADVSITKYDHGSLTPQDSLVVRIEGATAPSEVIVLGSHLDSIAGFMGGTRSPGADDNASGTATNLEVFRLLMEEGVRLERTLEIHAYAAEEIGLVGSNDIASDYRAQGVNVVAMVQHDMTLWKAAGAPDKIWLVTSNTDAGFNGLLSQLVSGYTGLPVEQAALSGGSSDHASWKRAGYAAAFPFENPSAYNRHIHTSNDTLANSGALTQAAGFAKLGLAYVMHFGGLD